MVVNKVDFSESQSENTIDVDYLQQGVIELLDEINLLIDNTQSDLENLTESKYDLVKDQITAAVKNVADLELRMAIVAPMKAGKSTIINAIAGQELLPSCAVAMTTIPTEIVFDAKTKQTILHLTKDTIDLFQNIANNIKDKVNRFGLESLQPKLDRYPHLLDLFTEITQSSDFAFTEQVMGRKAIDHTLNRLNHTIRLSSIIDPTEDYIARLKDVPRIQTPWLKIGKNRKIEARGNLTIIDTPGPNEAEEGLHLTAVVEEQLRRSSIVLVVLDFTQLNSEAAKTIKQQIQPIVESIGQDNLYVAINKIDQRRQGDMTKEQVKQFVVADLGLTNNDNDRIFEMAAIRAFSATKFLLEVQQNPKIQLLQIKSLTSLAQEVLGIDWDEELEDITVKIMAQKAGKLWRKSGFAPFIESAISTLIGNAAPKCINNALNLSRSHLLSIKDDLNLRHNAINQDTAKIQSEIESLENDLSYLESCRDRLSTMADVKIKLQQNLQNILEQLKTEAVIDVESFFAGEEYQKADAIKKADIHARNLLMSNLGDFELFPKWVSENIRAGIEYKTSGTISFKTELEAEYFTQQAIDRAKKHLEELILKVSQDIEVEVKKSREELEKFLIEETQDIITRAKNRLQTAFEIELDLPSPIISSNQEIQIERQLVKTKSRLVDDGYEERLVKKRAWYYWFGAIPFYSQEKRKKPYKKEDYSAVSVTEIVEQINESSDRFVDEIQAKVTVYLEKELHQQVDNFFVKLDEYLGGYLSSLQQAQSDHKLSLEKREHLAKSLAKLVPQTTDCISKTDSYLEKTQKIMINS
ncbi:dynamin family protein [Waterburya agarophytonicola K14]|uniref:Dynamin family protein n=1 Tax=Waterburya agarophytonicola KI4 TaxID=2874699 RepID=A0A964FF05_9CYAN|nr:dynamin family protein [Waterburya agarophytonicola]MCC0177235.1 dynamin family protein [Waterburya agarophytonicola KI4]